MQVRASASSTQWVTVVFWFMAVLAGAGAGILVSEVSEASKLVVIVVGVFAFAASVTRLDWGLLVLVFITYTRFSDVAIRYHGAPSTAKLFVFLLLIGIFIRWVFYRERPEGWVPVTILMGAYGLVGLLSIFYATDTVRVQDASIDFAKDALIAISVTILLHRMELLRRVIWAFLAAGIFLGTISVIQYFTGTFDNIYWGFAQTNVMHIFGSTQGARITGPLGDPNFYAQIMLVLIPLAIDRVLGEHKRGMRILALWALVVCSLALIFTFSRGGFVAVVLMLGFYVLVRPPRMSAWIILLLVMILVLQFIPVEYTSRMTTLLDFLPGFDSSPSVQMGASFSGRTSELLSGLYMFVESPIVGVGVDNYPLLYQEYAKRFGLARSTSQRSAHNLYIEIAAERGIFGLVSFGLLVFVMYRGIYFAWISFKEHKMYANANMVAAIGVAIFGYLASAMFIHDSYPRYLWLLVGIAFSLPNILKQEINNQLPH
jgi:putative inorganic carbon (hco3(-)) transporter